MREAELLLTQREGKQIYYSLNYAYVNKLSSLTEKLLMQRAQGFVSEKIVRKPVRKILSGDVKFTPTEIKIIQLVCREKTSGEIAQELGLGKRTIEGYRMSIVRKMKVRNSVGILIYAVKHGIFKI